MSFADVVIDSFEDRPEGLPLVGGFLSQQSLFTQDYPHVLGGRGMGVIGTTLAIGHFPEASVDINNFNGESSLVYRSLTVNLAGDFKLGYGGVSFISEVQSLEVPNTIGAQPLGLTVNPITDFLRITFSAYDHAGGQDLILKTYLQMDLAQIESGTTTPPDWTSILDAPGPQTVDIPLKGFADPTLNFVAFDFLAPEGTSFQLDSVAFITGVPEPNTIWLIGPVFAFWIRRKTRLRQAR